MMNKRKAIILFVALFLMLSLDYVFYENSFGITNVVSSHQLVQSEVPYNAEISVSTIGPNYFFPYSYISSTLTNKYSDEIKGFNLEMSTDNVSWVEIPLSNVNKFTSFGIISINTFSDTVYARVSFPNQNQTESTTNNILSSFTWSIEINPLFTPETIVVFILLSLALFSFVVQILDFVFTEK